MSKQNNLKDYLTDLYAGIATKKPDASRNPQNFRAEIESIESASKLTTATLTSNNTFKAKDYDADGFSQVTVNVKPKLQEKTTDKNGTVKADTGYDGLSKVEVNVKPILQAKTTDKNGIVLPDAGYDGLSKVTVNVAGGATAPLYESSVELLSGISYYYNFRQLPEIPAFVYKDYPYICILLGGANGDIRIIASGEKVYYRLDDGKLIMSNCYLTLNARDVGWGVHSGGSSAGYAVSDGTWMILWSNHDIPKGARDATEIYFPASAPKANEPYRGLCNGQSFPALPSDVPLDHKYMIIYRNKSRYDLATRSTPFVVQKSTQADYDVAVASGNSSAKNYGVAIEDGDAGVEWEYRNDTSYAYALSDGLDVVWSNHDVLHGSDIYIYGTPFIPDLTS